MDEHDACGLVAVARKDGAADERVLAEVIAGLCSLAHRSGRVDGEGDGAGVLTDIPRRLWSERLRSRGVDGAHAYVDRFAVAHLFIPSSTDETEEAAVRRIVARHRITLLMDRAGTPASAARRPRGRAGQPRLWPLPLLAPLPGALRVLQ